VDELLACADLFLLPSENESFGLAALEAMACGAPVVASNAGGIPEVVAHGETGYLFDVGAVQDMAEGSIEILTDPAKKRAFAEAGRRVAIERFSAASVVPMYERLYERVLAGGGGK
jgi:glycosyltransferase involved in cell wall biosynthesis